MKIWYFYWKLTLAIQDADQCFFIDIDLETFSIASLAHLCTDQALFTSENGLKQHFNVRGQTDDGLFY